MCRVGPLVAAVSGSAPPVPPDDTVEAETAGGAASPPDGGVFCEGGSGRAPQGLLGVPAHDPPPPPPPRTGRLRHLSGPAVSPVTSAPCSLPWGRVLRPLSSHLVSLPPARLRGGTPFLRGSAYLQGRPCAAPGAPGRGGAPATCAEGIGVRLLWRGAGSGA